MNIDYRIRALAMAAGLLVAFASSARTALTAAEQRAPDSPCSVRASDVIDATVVNADNVELGTVDDIVIVGSSGELHAIISVGGVLGIGDALYAVSPPPRSN